MGLTQHVLDAMINVYHVWVLQTIAPLALLLIIGVISYQQVKTKESRLIMVIANAILAIMITMGKQCVWLVIIVANNALTHLLAILVITYREESICQDLIATVSLVYLMKLIIQPAFHVILLVKLVALSQQIA